MTSAVSAHSVGLVRRLLGTLFAASAIFSVALFFSGISGADDEAMLTGNHPVEAESFRQLGEASPNTSLEMQIRFALRNKRGLEKLLADQQNPASANYHKWLTRDEFVKRFGPSPAQVNSVADWLTSEGFTVTRRSGSSLEFSGAVAQTQRTFAVRIAKFGDGSVYANTSDPIIPKRFAGLIGSVSGLDNMVHAVPLVHPNRLPTNASKQIGKQVVPAELPLQLAMAESTGGGMPIPDVILGGAQAFGPADVRTFYDESVGAGADGTGSCIAIVDISDFLDSTMTAFTSQFGLPAINYTRVVEGSNPGIINGVDAESELDLQWAHVTAPGASIKFYLGSNLVSDIAGAVNGNACSAISISYGFCGISSSFMTNTMDPIFQQAAAQGQSVFVSAGDQGVAGITLNANGTACEVGTSKNVSELSADPNVTSVGGTEFSPTYVSGNDQGYATEQVWNDGSGATGGGASQVFTKPAYQKGSGVPNDGVRDVPDIALIASPNFPGVFWADDVGGSAEMSCCIGGTSLSAPLWAGFSVVIGQTVGNRLGNLNQIIYPLANTSYATAGFHDITSGNNNYNGVSGFTAGPGYDQATGWGSIDFNVFAGAVKNFLSPSSSPTRTATATPTATSTATRTATATPTIIRTSTPTATATRTATPTITRTSTPTVVATPIPTVAPTSVPSAKASPTITKTSTPTATPTPAGGGMMSVASSVTFPTTTVGTRATKTLTISNLSSSSMLTISVGSLGGPFVVYYPGGYSIRPGWSLQLTITFTPSQAGTVSQNLIMTSSDPRYPRVSVQVVGNGVKSSSSR